MKHKITIREIAQQAGVSTATVSHVVNHTRFVSPGVRARVEQALRDLGYTPNSLARSLRSGRTKTIGLLLPDSSNPFFAEIAHYVETNAYREGYSLIICNTEGNAERELFYLETLTQRKVDGILFVSTGASGESIRLLQDLEINVVIADRDPEGALGEMDLTVVMTDNRTGGRLAADHLLGLGHTQVACIAGPASLSPALYRQTGFQERLAEAGCPLRAEWLLHGDFSTSAGNDLARQLLQNPADRPTAIFCCNDMMAFGAIRAAADLGLRVPQDVSIVGFDDIALSSYFVPALTTVHQPVREICETITRCLFQSFETHARLPRQQLVLRPHLVQRQSSAKVLPPDEHRRLR